MMGERKIKTYYQAIVHEFEDGGVRLMFERIDPDGNTVRLYEVGESNLPDAFSVLSDDMTNGFVFRPAVAPFVDGMVVNHDGLLFARRNTGAEDSSWGRVDLGGWAHPDEQIRVWLDADEATIVFDPRSTA